MPRDLFLADDPDAMFAQHWELELAYTWCKGSPQTRWEPGEPAHPEDVRFTNCVAIIEGERWPCAAGSGCNAVLAKFNAKLRDDKDFYQEVVDRCFEIENAYAEAMQEAKAEARSQRYA